MPPKWNPGYATAYGQVRQITPTAWTIRNSLPFFHSFVANFDLFPTTTRKPSVSICFLANMNYAICCRPSVCLPVCLSSVTFVRPTQAVQIFGNISTALGTLAIRWHWKFCGDRPRGTRPSGELNTTGVAKYSDFGPIEGYISETVQDRK